MRQKLSMTLLCWLSLISYSSLGSDIEFNDYFVKSNSKIDLSQFEKKDFILDGEYSLDVYFNGDFLTSRKVNIKDLDVCVDKELLNIFPLSDDGLDKYSNTLIKKRGMECYKVESVPYSNLNVDMPKGKLELSFPQEYLAEEYKNGFVNPRFWDDGINGLFLDYNINYFTTKQSNDSQWYDDLVGFGLLGTNIGPVRLRAHYQQSKYMDGEFSSYYGYIPFRQFKSRFTFGNTPFGSEIYDSFRMRGIRLQSDDKMLPSYMRGYSPVISGTVDSNAVITLSQQGRVLKVLNVNPGPYVIDDLSEATQGNIDVEVRKADGQRQVFQVSGASVQYLTRPGHFRYSLSAGVPESDIYEHTPVFASGEIAYGLTNNLSLFSGALLSQDYQVYTLGSGINMNKFGALSFDVSLAQTQTEESDKYTGMAYGFSYNNTLTDWGLGLRVAGSRFSQEKFFEFDEYLHSYDEPTSAYLYSVNNKKKTEKYITLTQRFTNSSVFFSYSLVDYWDDRRNNERYDVTFSKPFTISGLTFYLNANIYKSEGSLATYSYENGIQSLESQNDDGWSLGISIPLGNSNTVSIQSKTNNNKYSQTIAYSGRDEKNNAHYRLSFDEYEGESIGGSVNYSRKFSNVSTLVGGSYQKDNYTQLNANVSGTVLLTKHGLAYSNLNAGDTRLLIDTKVEDVSIQGTGKQSSNMFGLALVNGISPYQKTWNTIDYKLLPKNIEVFDSINSVVLTEGAIGFQSIKARYGENFLARLMGAKDIPFGASVIDEETEDEVGIVGSEQVVYLKGINKETQLRVIWGDDEFCLININSEEIESKNNIRQLACL